MPLPRHAPSPGDLTMELANISGALGIITIPLFPFALPALLLVVVPLMLPLVAIALLAAPFVLAVWLVRAALRARQPRQGRPKPISTGIGSGGPATHT